MIVLEELLRLLRLVVLQLEELQIDFLILEVFVEQGLLSYKILPLCQEH
jgi:hypothetical protein